MNKSFPSKVKLSIEQNRKLNFAILTKYFPVYILFELCWLVTGTVWVLDPELSTDTCDTTIYMFSVVVMINFWIHILTPLIFMMVVCCSKIGVCDMSLWSLVNNAVEHWTRTVR